VILTHSCIINILILINKIVISQRSHRRYNRDGSQVSTRIMYTCIVCVYTLHGRRGASDILYSIAPSFSDFSLIYVLSQAVIKFPETVYEIIDTSR
jgi:hypothetical protein